jgi:carboxypeptidase family protein
MVKRTLLVWMAALLLVLPALLAAQAEQGQIKGRVTDTTGNPLSGVTVIVRNTTTGTERETTTDNDGRFSVEGLGSGRYTVQSQRGQTTLTGPSTSVDVDTTNNLNLQQTPAGDLQVTAETKVSDTSTAPIKTVFGSTQVELLPQPNAITRTGQFYGAYNLALLSDGVTPGYLQQFGVGPSVGGRPNTSNNYHVLGTDNNNQAFPGPLVTVSNEASTDFALMQGHQAPQFGHVTGGQLNFGTMNGSNQWHGGVYDYLNNRKLNAIEPALGSNGVDRRYDQNRFGAKAGGPLIKNSVFAFANFEYIPLRFDGQLVNPVLSPTVFGLATAATIPGVSATNLGVLRNNVVAPTTAVTTTTVNGVAIPLGFVNTSSKVSQDQFNGIANFDWNMRGQSALGFRYVHNDTGTDMFNSGLPTFAVPGHKRALLGAVNYTATPSPRLTFNANAGYNRLDQKVGGGNFIFPGQTAFPNINIQDLGLGLGSNVAVGRARTNMYQGSGGVDWMPTGHHFRFGADVRRALSVIGNFGGTNSDAGFSSLDRFLRDLPPDVGARRLFGSPAFTNHQTLFYAFAQDTIRYKGLDWELGLGYEYATLPTSVNDQSNLAALSVPGLITFAKPKTDTMNFAPRVGVAWSPSNSQTVVRGAFGMMYDALNGNALFFSPTFVTGATTSAALNTPGFFATGGVPIPTTGPASVGSFVFDQELPYIIHWSGAVSHGFFNKLGVELKYMGHHAVHQPLDSILNNSTRVTSTASLPVFFTNPGQATLNALPFTQAGLAAAPNAFTAAGFTTPIAAVQPVGTGWYNAGVLKITETFTAGTQVSAEYTYSDNRADATGTPLDLAFGRRMEQTPWNMKHRANVTAFFDVASMLPTKSGIVHDIVANLSIMGTVMYGYFPKVPLFSATDTGLDGNPLGSGVFINPNGVAGTASGVTPLTNSSGSTVAFLAQNPNAQFVSGAPGTFSLARPTVRLDDTRNVDLAVVKRFQWKDRAKIEVRGDGYNVFNHAQFTGMPITTLGTGMGFIVPPSFLVVSNPNFNNSRGFLSGNPRTIQLALRVLF